MAKVSNGKVNIVTHITCTYLNTVSHSFSILGSVWYHRKWISIIVAAEESSFKALATLTVDELEQLVLMVDKLEGCLKKALYAEK